MVKAVSGKGSNSIEPEAITGGKLLGSSFSIQSKLVELCFERPPVCLVGLPLSCPAMDPLSLDFFGSSADGIAGDRSCEDHLSAY
jgi:hypothetical protein